MDEQHQPLKRVKKNGDDNGGGGGDDGDFSFIFPNGDPVPARSLFSAYSDVVISIFSKATDKYNMLRGMEQAGKMGQSFIQKHDLWKRAFMLDYPSEYGLALEDPGSSGFDLSPNYKQQLDMLSQNPEREHTYWKRIYEWMLYIPTFLRYNARVDIAKVQHTSRLSRAPENDLRVLSNGDLYPIGGQWHVWFSKSLGRDVIYVVPNLGPIEANIRPVKIVMVDMNRLSSSVVHYNPEDMNGYASISYSPRLRYVWRSQDGLRWYAKDSLFTFWIYDIDHVVRWDGAPLVSKRFGGSRT